MEFNANTNTGSSELNPIDTDDDSDNDYSEITTKRQKSDFTFSSNKSLKHENTVSTDMINDNAIDENLSEINQSINIVSNSTIPSNSNNEYTKLDESASKLTAEKNIDCDDNDGSGSELRHSFSTDGEQQVLNSTSCTPGPSPFSKSQKRYLNRNYRTKHTDAEMIDYDSDQSGSAMDDNEEVVADNDSTRNAATYAETNNEEMTISSINQPINNPLNESRQRAFSISPTLSLSSSSNNSSVTSSLSSSSSTVSSSSLSEILQLRDSTNSSLITDTDESDSDAEGDPDDLNQNGKVECIKMVKSLMAKPSPRCTWKLVPELYRRQIGLCGTIRHRNHAIDGNVFENKCYGSLFSVEHLRNIRCLREHNGCVNSLNFNKTGNLLVSGSDDLRIIIWKWAANKIALSFESGHILNIYQTKFLELHGTLNIVSSGRDGFVRHHAVLPSGGKPLTCTIAKHEKGVHRICTSNEDPYEVLSAGEDGIVYRCDLREQVAKKLVTVKTKANRRVNLYSIANHPLNGEFCVCGDDLFLRVYDRRNVKRPMKMFSPDSDADEAKRRNRFSHMTHITCAVYNYLGTEILASAEKDAYLFDNTPTSSPILHKYSGHRNLSTIKGINFFGPRSEFIVSGSDCGNIFFWDKENESIVQWLSGDDTGSVNCVETHPTLPTLATSGIDSEIKIFMPYGSHKPNPDFRGLEKCLFKNLISRYRPSSEGLFDIQFRSFWQRVRDRHRQRNLLSDDDEEPAEYYDNEDEYNNLSSPGPPTDTNVAGFPCSPS